MEILAATMPKGVVLAARGAVPNVTNRPVAPPAPALGVSRDRRARVMQARPGDRTSSSRPLNDRRSPLVKEARMSRWFSPEGPHAVRAPHVARRPQVQLEITRGKARRLWRPMQTPAYLIGSAPDCDLVLLDPQIGAAHAYLLRDDERLTLRWLGCGPEVKVNGRTAAGPVELGHLDRVQTGPFELRIHLQEANLAADAADAQ